MSDEGILSFIDSLGSTDPTPGGGAAAGLGAAVGVGAILMSVRFSTNSKKLTEEQVEQLEDAVQRLEESKEKFLDLKEQDAEGFKPLSEAYKLPAETEEEKAHKKEEVQKGLVSASKTPLALIREGEKVVDLTEEIIPLLKRFIVSDAGVGLQLIRAAMKSSSLNVYINADMMTDTEQKEKHIDIADTLVDKTCGRIDTLFAEIQNIIRKK